jgi:AraC-like DNA-binding protein
MTLAIKNKIEDNLLLKVSRMKPVIKPTKPHKHAGYHELIFLSKGLGNHTIDDGNYEVKPNMGFYLKPGQVHCWNFTQIPEGFVIIFKEEFLSNHTDTLNNLYRMPAKFDITASHELDPLLEQFYTNFKSNGDSKILQAYLNLILLKALALANHEPKIKPSLNADFYAFKSLVNDHFLEKRKVSQYAELMRMSVKRLNNISQSVMQTSAFDIIRERLLLEAKNLITHSSLSITEVAYQLKFNDPSNFVKFFKSLTTLTPLEYREKLKV